MIVNKRKTSKLLQFITYLWNFVNFSLHFKFLLTFSFPLFCCTFLCFKICICLESVFDGFLKHTTILRSKLKFHK